MASSDIKVGATDRNSSNQLRNLVFLVNKSHSRKKGSNSDLDQAIAAAITPKGDVDKYKSFVEVDLGMRKGETRNLARSEVGLSSKSSANLGWNCASFNQNRPQNCDQSGRNLERSLPESVMEFSDIFPGNSITL
jgi:hypothetical protein